MSMSPAQSPGGLFSKPVGGKRVSPRALILIISSIAISFVILFAVIFGRGKRVDAAGKQPQLNAQMAGAKPPSDLTSPEKSSGFVQKTQQYFAPRPGAEQQLSPELLKERAEYDKEIRRDAHQRHMVKIAIADSAMSADIVGEKGSSDSTQQVASVQGSEMSNQDGPATIQRLPNGEFGLATPGSMGQLSDADPNMQLRKEAFGNRAEASASYLPFQKTAPLSPYEVKQGSVIPGIMITGINSDLPGQIIAQVSQNVYDSTSGQYLLIPQGTKIMGSYDSFVAIGQERAMVAWRRLIFPDGNSLELLNMAGADQGGYSGFNDQVNNHYFKIFGSAIILSFLGAGFQLSQPDSHGEFPTNREIVAAETARNLNQVGSELMRRKMNIQPTLEIRPGYRFNIIVNKDIILEPYVAQ